MIPFQEFPKIARFSREIIVTEKIDGTNASIFIASFAEFSEAQEQAIYTKDGLFMLAGSRTRWITPKDDNYGFAGWAQEHAQELFELGPGHHFGEWWGKGVQRNYSQAEKRFSLFNVTKWADVRPACCDVVPVLYRGEFGQSPIMGALKRLEKEGSMAAPGFMKPEGIVIYHTAANCLFKKTLEKDDMPKSLAAESVNAAA